MKIQKSQKNGHDCCMSTLILNNFQLKNKMNITNPVEPTELQKCQEEKRMMKSKRRSKRAEVKQIFECQCGKTYLSFSALYLHARNKHDAKFSSKPEEEVCNIKKLPGLTKFTYMLNLSSKQELVNSIPCPEENNPAMMERNEEDKELRQGQVGRERFINEVVDEWVGSRNQKEGKKIVCNFLKHVFKSGQNSYVNPEKVIEAAAYGLNEFVLDVVPEQQKIQIHSIEWKNNCLTLLAFCEWLKDTNRTDLEVLYQQM